MTDLSSDLAAAAQRAAYSRPPCRACLYLDTLLPGVQKDQVEAAIAGSIGINTLASIFRRHEVPVGRRAIETHRKHLEAQA